VSHLVRWDGDRALTTCALCSQACRVDRRGDRLAVHCYGGCAEAGVLEALDVDHVLAELAAPAANGSSSAEARHNGRPTEKLRRLDLAHMVREDPPPVPWVVEGLVVRGALTVLNGREGEGKSLLAMALAAGVVTGQDEGGLACEQGRVVIVDAENGENEIHRRVRTLELPDGSVELFEAQGFDLRSDLGELAAVLERSRPDLLILDSYRTLWGGEENDSREVAAVLDPLRNLVRRYDAGALLLHHSGKINGAYRGSTAIGASAELGFGLTRLADDPDPTRCYLETWKCRPAARPPRRWMRLAVEGGRVFIDAAEPPDSEAADDARPKAPAREALAPVVLAALPGPGDSPATRADLARACGRGAKDRSVGRVLDELASTGQAERTENGWRRRGVAGAEPPIGGCHPATLPANPHSKAENRGGRPPATPGALPPPGGHRATPAEEAEFDRVRAKFEVLEGGAL